MANGSDSSRSLQHVTFSVAGQIGFSWAGASGRAKYEKDAKQDSSASTPYSHVTADGTSPGG